MSRLTEKREKPLTTKWEDVPTSYYKIKGDDTGVVISEIERLNKLGKLEDLIEKYKIENTDVLEKIIVRHDSYTMLEAEIGVNDLIAFLKWCVMFRNNFINRSFDDMVAFYKKTWWLREDKSE